MCRLFELREETAQLIQNIAGGMLGGAIGFVLLAAIFGAWWA